MREEARLEGLADSGVLISPLTGEIVTKDGSHKVAENIVICCYNSNVICGWIDAAGIGLVVGSPPLAQVPRVQLASNKPLT